MSTTFHHQKNSQINNLKQMGLFIGIVVLQDDQEIMKQTITLSKFRFLLKDCLQLHPFLELVERYLVTEMIKGIDEQDLSNQEILEELVGQPLRSNYHPANIAPSKKSFRSGTRPNFTNSNRFAAGKDSTRRAIGLDLTSDSKSRVSPSRQGQSRFIQEFSMKPQPPSDSRSASKTGEDQSASFDHQTTFQNGVEYIQPVITDQMLKDLNLDLLSPSNCDKLKLKISSIDRILSSQQLFVNIPDYVNGKSTNININLIKTSIAILMRGFLSFKQIHDAVMAFDIKSKQLHSDNVLPLREDILTDTMRPMGISLPSSLFTMWCKKCWRFLDCAQIESQKQKKVRLEKPKKPLKSLETAKQLPHGNQSVSSFSQNRATPTNAVAIAAGSASASDEPYKNYYIFPHEFISLVCNARDRLFLLDTCFKPNFSIEKEEYYGGLDPATRSAQQSARICMYKLTREEIAGDFRPYGILRQEMENDFYDNIPNHDEGKAISNKQAGINPTKKSRQLNIHTGVTSNKNAAREKLYGSDPTQNPSLREQLIQCRKDMKQMEDKKNKFLTEVEIRKENTKQRKIEQFRQVQESKKFDRQEFSSSDMSSRRERRISVRSFKNESAFMTEVAKKIPEDTRSQFSFRQKRVQSPGLNLIRQHRRGGNIFIDLSKSMQEGTTDSKSIDDSIMKAHGGLSIKKQEDIEAGERALKNQAQRLLMKMNISKDMYMSQVQQIYLRSSVRQQQIQRPQPSTGRSEGQARRIRRNLRPKSNFVYSKKREGGSPSIQVGQHTIADNTTPSISSPKGVRHHRAQMVEARISSVKSPKEAIPLGLIPGASISSSGTRRIMGNIRSPIAQQATGGDQYSTSVNKFFARKGQAAFAQTMQFERERNLYLDPESGAQSGTRSNNSGAISSGPHQIQIQNNLTSKSNFNLTQSQVNYHYPEALQPNSKLNFLPVEHRKRSTAASKDNSHRGVVLQQQQEQEEASNNIFNQIRAANGIVIVKKNKKMKESKLSKSAASASTKPVSSIYRNTQKTREQFLKYFETEEPVIADNNIISQFSHFKQKANQTEANNMGGVIRVSELTQGQPLNGHFQSDPNSVLREGLPPGLASQEDTLRNHITHQFEKPKNSVNVHLQGGGGQSELSQKITSLTRAQPTESPQVKKKKVSSKMKIGSHVSASLTGKDFFKDKADESSAANKVHQNQLMIALANYSNETSQHTGPATAQLWDMSAVNNKRQPLDKPSVEPTGRGSLGSALPADGVQAHTVEGGTRVMTTEPDMNPK